jgi:sugar phosphate isomerase/epimerase
MPIKFAFSSVSPPTADAPGLFARAREAGYDGVELTAAAADPAHLRDTAQAAGIEIACLASKFEIPAKAGARNRATADARQLIETAAALGCPLLRLRAGVARRGQGTGAYSAELGEWLRPLANRAAERGVTILIDSMPPFARSRDLWTLLDLLDHPSVGAAWDLASAARVGETPYVAVPTLNSRIRYVVVREEEPAVHSLLDRLRGIGYGGYVAVQASDATTATALAKLRVAAALPVTAGVGAN